MIVFLGIMSLGEGEIRVKGVDCARIENPYNPIMGKPNNLKH
jgi:hypothetical protein